MKKWLAVLLLFLVATSTAQAAVQCHAPDKSILSSVVRIAGDDDSHASGVVIGRNVVLTAAHVVEGVQDVTVKIDGKFRRAQVYSIDQDKDLAALIVATETLSPIYVSRGSVDESERVWAIGYPLAREQISASGRLRTVMNGDLHTTAPVNSGQSGGGLIGCDDGRLVLAGMLRGFGAVERDGEYVRVDNYSVSTAASDIWNFLYANGLVKVRTR